MSQKWRHLDLGLNLSQVPRTPWTDSYPSLSSSLSIIKGHHCPRDPFLDLIMKNTNSLVSGWTWD